MEKLRDFVVILLFLVSLFHGEKVTGLKKSQDGSEEWGYVQVRPSKS